MRNLLIFAYVTACAGPPDRATPVAADSARATVRPAGTARVDDVPAGDSATFGGRDPLGGDTVFSFADYHTRTADIVHLERYTDSLITVASLVLPVRWKDHIVLHECRLDGVPDPEVMAVYQDDGDEPDGAMTATSRTAKTVVHPLLAWRASRARARFEPLDPRRVTCSFDELVD